MDLSGGREDAELPFMSYLLKTNKLLLMALGGGDLLLVFGCLVWLLILGSGACHLDHLAPRWRDADSNGAC